MEDTTPTTIPAYTVDPARRILTITDMGDFSLDEFDTSDKLLRFAYKLLEKLRLTKSDIMRILECCSEATGVPIAPFVC